MAPTQPYLNNGGTAAAVPPTGLENFMTLA